MTGDKTLPILADAYRLAEVVETPTELRDHAAQLACARLRREQHPSQPTWGPFDPEPYRQPENVRDGDGDIWRRGLGNKQWRMAGFDPENYEPQAGGAYSWHELLERYGPLTED